MYTLLARQAAPAQTFIQETIDYEKIAISTWVVSAFVPWSVTRPIAARFMRPESAYCSGAQGSMLDVVSWHISFVSRQARQPAALASAPACHLLINRDRNIKAYITRGAAVHFPPVTATKRAHPPGRQ